jgi:anti-sigma B factor antagonist
MTLSTKYYGSMLLVTADMNRIDAAIAIQFKDDMRAKIDETAHHVVLDLTRVSFIDSSGLGAIVASMKQLGVDKKLDLAGLSETVAKVFRLTRMDMVFKIHETVEEAVADAKQ